MILLHGILYFISDKANIYFKNLSLIFILFSYFLKLSTYPEGNFYIKKIINYENENLNLPLNNNTLIKDIHHYLL